MPDISDLEREHLEQHRARLERLRLAALERALTERDGKPPSEDKLARVAARPQSWAVSPAMFLSPGECRQVLGIPESEAPAEPVPGWHDLMGR